MTNDKCQMTNGQLALEEPSSPPHFPPRGRVYHSIEMSKNNPPNWRIND